jgi:hypothetical protein
MVQVEVVDGLSAIFFLNALGGFDGFDGFDDFDD